MSLVWGAYRLAAPLIGAAAPAARAFAPAAERALWGERMGRVEPEPAGTDAWVHAASLGEALAAGSLVRALADAAPAARFHLTANTRAGRTRLAEFGHSFSLAPLDAPQAVTRFIGVTRPRRLFLIETELWPHWMLAARAADIPVAVVSARLSVRAIPRYRRLGGGFRTLVAGLAAVLCQSAAEEARWRALGAPPGRTVVTGNLKDDALPEPMPGTATERSAARSALGLDPERPLLVLGSVRPGELRELARVWRGLAPEIRARWQVAALPRHTHAMAGLRREAAEAGQALAGEGAPPGGAWRWDERLGVLTTYYAAAEVAVVGGSIGPYGGHNPLEPAACGAAVIVGPHHASQADAVVALTGAGAARVAESAQALERILQEWLTNGERRAAAGAAGLAVVRARRGGARRAVARLEEWHLWPAV